VVSVLGSQLREPGLKSCAAIANLGLGGAFIIGPFLEYEYES